MASCAPFGVAAVIVGATSVAGGNSGPDRVSVVGYAVVNLSLHSSVPVGVSVRLAHVAPMFVSLKGPDGMLAPPFPAVAVSRTTYPVLG